MMSKWKTFGAAGLSAAMLLSGALPAAASELLQKQVPIVLKSPDGGTPLESAIMAKLDGNNPKDAPADAKIQKDEAIALAKKLGSVPEDYALEGIYFNAGLGAGPLFKQRPSWNVNFSKIVQDRYYGGINVTLDANSGRLLQYNRYDNDPGKKPVFPPKTDLEQAKRIALDFLKSLNADELKDTRYNDAFEQSFKTPLNGDVRYHIQYDRTVNGIPFPQNFISADVNGDGQVVGYSMNWDAALDFESAEGVIGLEQAKAKLAEQTDLFLTYQFPYETRGKDHKPLIAYQASIPSLNAKTGEPLDVNGAGSTPKNRTPLTQQPLAEKPGLGGALTKEQAVAEVVQAFKLPEGIKLEEASYSEQKNPYEEELQSFWNIRWSASDDEKDKMTKSNFIWASVDGKTGEVHSFNRNDFIVTPLEKHENDSAGEEKQLTWDEAKAIAIDCVKSIAPYYTNQLYLENETADDIPDVKLREAPSFQFRFKRIIDGVEAGYEGIYVGVDRKTGEINSYNNSFSTAAYPAQKPQVIPEAQAKSLLFDRYTVELQYTLQLKGTPGDPIPFDMPIEKYNALVATGKIKPEEAGGVQTKLAYVAVPKTGSWQNELYLDAVTGAWKQLKNGEPAQLTKPYITDVSGNKAEKELRMMVEYGALDVQDGKVSPERIMTRGEMIKMLVIAMNGGGGPVFVAENRKASFSDVGSDSPYFAYVESAVDRQLIDRDTAAFRPDAKMTRQDMADLIVRALGYHQLAQVPGLFALNASDADQVKDKGSAAIVMALGIMAPLDGAFKPAAEVSRADAAASFYRYLQKRSELQDRPPYPGW